MNYEIGDRVIFDAMPGWFRCTVLSAHRDLYRIKVTVAADGSIKSLPHVLPSGSHVHDWPYGDRYELGLSRRRHSDIARLAPEPLLELEPAKDVLRGEGATEFVDHGPLVLARRPSKTRPGEFATAVIRRAASGRWRIERWTA